MHRSVSRWIDESYRQQSVDLIRWRRLSNISMMACLVALSPLDSPPHQDRRSIGGSSISAETKSWRHAMSRTFRAAAPRDQIEATHTHTHTKPNSRSRSLSIVVERISRCRSSRLLPVLSMQAIDTGLKERRNCSRCKKLGDQ